ncbi:MAG: hypothetical protein KAH18_12500 [Psychromonas sp.]|nr:hypothetical protein [Psychromonas sp.]
MITIYFESFGGGFSPFSDLEKEMLRQAFSHAQIHCQKAYNASLSSFKRHRSELQLWFGNSKNITILHVISSIRKMHIVVFNPKIFITFVDARERYIQRGDLEFDTVHDAPSQEDNHFLKYQQGTRTIVQDNQTAFVNCISWSDHDAGCSNHVGLGMRVYVGHAMFSESSSPIKRSQTVIHELSHKILGTVDINLAGNLVYGERNCQQLAKTSPEQAIKHADCLAFFINSIEKKSYCSIL